MIGRLAFVVVFALIGTIEPANAITGKHFEKHWRALSGAPPLPHPELLFPREIPPFPSGFVITVEKAATDAQSEAPLLTPRAVADALSRCWSPPPFTGSPPQVTVRIQFTRSGEVIGRPRIAYVADGGVEGGREAIVASIMTAIAACAPLRFTESLGASIAGRTFAIRFIAGGGTPLRHTRR